MQETARADKPFRVAVIGAIANPNMGDEAILEQTLHLIERMYGKDGTVYVFSKKASYTACNTLSPLAIPTDCLHRITRACHYRVAEMRGEHERILSYAPGTHTDPTAEELHAIFSSIDLLHVVGGGYLNGIWPDMLEEVHLLARLAQHYKVRSIATGIGVYPIDGEHLDTLLETLDGFELVDFRDESMHIVREAYEARGGSAPRLQKTIDDAIAFGHNMPSSWDAYVPDDIRDMTPGRYLNVSLHTDKAVTDHKVPELILTWARSLIERKLISRVNLLLFSRDEERLYRHLAGSAEYPKASFRTIDLHDLHPYAVQQLIAHARYNVGTRYHEAVFSLAAGIPSFGISINPYYRFKLDSIFGPYGSENVVDVEECTPEALSRFEEGAASEHKRLVLRASAVQASYKEKLECVSRAYASARAAGDTLLEKMTSAARSQPAADEPLVSVVCPLRNAQGYVDALLDELSCQTLADIEIICVDDGSTDDTSRILVERAWLDRRIKLLSQKRLGWAQAANTGMRAARGAYVFFYDNQGHLASRSALALLYQAARARGVSLACGSQCAETEGTAQSPSPANAQEHRVPFGIVTPTEMPSYHCWNATLYARELLIGNGLSLQSDSLLAGERFFVSALMAAGKAYVAEIPALQQEPHAHNATAALTPEQTACLLDDATSLLDAANTHTLPLLREQVEHTIVFDMAPVIAPQLQRTRIPPELKRAIRAFGASCANGDGYSNEGSVMRALVNNGQTKPFEEQRREADAKQRALAKRHSDEIRRLQTELTDVRAQNAEQLARCEQEFTSSRTWKIGRLLTWIPRRLRKGSRREE